MTQKAQEILKQMREKDRRTRALARLNDPKHRNRLMDSLNRDTLDEGVGPVGDGDKEIKVLTEMNELQEFENENWSRGTV